MTPFKPPDINELMKRHWLRYGKIFSSSFLESLIGIELRFIRKKITEQN